MRRQFLDIEHAKAVMGEDPLDREQRKIGEMLVIDRVELAFLRSAAAGAETRMVDDAGRLQQDLQCRRRSR